jgi:hypothetical protein
MRLQMETYVLPAVTEEPGHKTPCLNIYSVSCLLVTVWICYIYMNTVDLHKIMLRLILVGSCIRLSAFSICYTNSKSRDSSVGTVTGNGLDGRGSIPLRPDRLWCALSHLFNGYEGFFPRRQSDRGVKLTTILCRDQE